MTWDLQWDDEVDVVCTDAGVAGLAGALSAADAGAEVLVAKVQAPQVSDAAGGPPGWFTIDSGDSETAAYLAELAGDLDPAALSLLDDGVPVRPAPTPAAPPARKVPPFVGAELREWTSRCIRSPSGYLYTRVTDWTATAMLSATGDAVGITEIGSMSPGPGDRAGSVLDWLDTEARSRDVDVEVVTRLDRLVFEDGQVVGAVFTTADGPLAVRARHGVLLCRAGVPARGTAQLPAAGVMRVALVSKSASRFGRVELLTADPA
ncbi:FAD-binding protein [Mycolicibacterium vanbaalenii]|uniref:FAD-binding protein n=1 Tax=Mycolicibacterium vanbaalenii TaxID=110539 RepID=UPI001F236598|nr:FAD-binding protein [Mycolicibacterium vanbaalenii]